MLLIIKSAPDTPEGKGGIRLAERVGADIVLLQNGTYFARKNKLESFSGAAFILDDDKKLRGLKDSDLEERVKFIDYDGLIDLMTQSNKVLGIF
jgi:sulfur relay protein TusB/DsrH